jgi:hypothetical protein
LNEISLNEIFYKSQRFQYLKNLKKIDFPKCITCIDRPYCEMCLVQNANENEKGDIFSIPNYCCEVASLKHKIFAKWKDNYLDNNSE